MMYIPVKPHFYFINVGFEGSQLLSLLTGCEFNMEVALNLCILKISYTFVIDIMLPIHHRLRLSLPFQNRYMELLCSNFHSIPIHCKEIVSLQYDIFFINQGALFL